MFNVAVLQKAEVLNMWTGLRPKRNPVRVEMELLPTASGTLKVRKDNSTMTDILSFTVPEKRLKLGLRTPGNSFSLHGRRWDGGVEYTSHMHKVVFYLSLK